MKKYAKDLSEAKKLYKTITGHEFNPGTNQHSTTRIFKLKIKKTPTRRYFVGTYTDWLNL